VPWDGNFFEIGGNSFAALQVHERLRSHMAIECTVTDLFRYPTITGWRSTLSQTSQSAAPVTRRDRAMAARALAATRG